MIKIKSVDPEMVEELCRLSAEKEGCMNCAAFAIAVSRYEPAIHVNAIYDGKAIAGYFMYERDEDSPETAIIRHFAIFDMDSAKEAFDHIMKGFRFQKVRTVIISIDCTAASSGCFSAWSPKKIDSARNQYRIEL